MWKYSSGRFANYVHTTGSKANFSFPFITEGGGEVGQLKQSEMMNFPGRG